MLLHIKESSQRENLNHLFCRKVSFLTVPHCQFRDVGQGRKQTYLTCIIITKSNTCVVSTFVLL